MAYEVDPARSAVLSLDLQAAIVSIYTKTEADVFVARVARVLDHARASGIQVIHVRVGFRPGLPEIGSRNPLFAAIKQSAQHQKLFTGPTGEIHGAVAPLEGEAVVTKHRVGAFAGTDLEILLRASDIDTLVLFGIATSGVVLSTALHASDADYRLFIIGDCCADLDRDLHIALLERLFPSRATVLSSSDFISVPTRSPS